MGGQAGVGSASDCLPESGFASCLANGARANVMGERLRNRTVANQNGPQRGSGRNSQNRKTGNRAMDHIQSRIHNTHSRNNKRQNRIDNTAHCIANRRWRIDNVHIEWRKGIIQHRKLRYLKRQTRGPTKNPGFLGNPCFLEASEVGR